MFALPDTLCPATCVFVPLLRPAVLFLALAVLLVDDLLVEDLAPPRFRAWAVRGGGVFGVFTPTVSAETETVNNSNAVNRRMGW